MTERIDNIASYFNSNEEKSILKAFEEIKNLKDPTDQEIIDLAAALTTIFYHHGPGLVANLNKLIKKSIKEISRLGEKVIPFLFDEIINADSESAIHLGKAMAKLDGSAVQYIRERWTEFEDDDFAIINLIQTLSYFKRKEITDAIPDILALATHENYQIRAMALYSTGKLAFDLKPEILSAELRNKMFDATFPALKDQKHLVRKNAARTLGKMKRRNLFNERQEQMVYGAYQSILGKDGKHKWDKAFIVRHEAEYFLQFFKDTPTEIHRNRYSQSFKINSKTELCHNTFYYELEAPLIARKIQAGQFVIVRPHAYSERIPLSVCGWDESKGIINLVVVSVGKTTKEINSLSVGDSFEDVVGPLGERSQVGVYPGTCVVIGGGYGAGAIIPTARDLKMVGNKVKAIVGARTKELLLFENKLEEVCDDLIQTTNDGSKGIRGMVTDALKKIIETEVVSYVLAVGPVPMMRSVSELTRDMGIETYVSLNAIMVDATGMCGACRVTVGGETKFACFHGPDFNGHKVDFEELEKRQKMFAKQEQAILES